MSGQATYDVLLKCIIIGDSGSGKSCILHRFTEGSFVEDQAHTIGVEFGAKIVPIMGKEVKLQIWDTAGQERYRSVTRSYYRGAAACLLVFDLTNRESFLSVQQWLQDARLLAGPDIVVMLVGNKCDIAFGDQRRVTTAEATQLAGHNGMLYFETSAVTGEYIEEAFNKIAKTVLMRQQDSSSPRSADGNEGSSLSLREKVKAKKKEGCSC